MILCLKLSVMVAGATSQEPSRQAVSQSALSNNTTRRNDGFNVEERDKFLG